MEPVLDTASLEYKRAFEAYMRKGLPIGLSLKEERTTTHYIWRTRGDGKVRDSHAANNGKIFAWDNPPSTGHPGEDYGCRCIAEPYTPEFPENIQHTLSIGNNSGNRWENVDFVKHFYFGGGRSVTLSEIGHLHEVANYWAHHASFAQSYSEIDRLRSYFTTGTGALDRWTRQIIGKAISEPDGSFTEKFDNVYALAPIEFSHGDARIKGDFSGSVRRNNGAMFIKGISNIKFEDRFTDPIDLRDISAATREGILQLWRLVERTAVYFNFMDASNLQPIDIDKDDVSTLFFLLSEIGGTGYTITGNWKSHLEANIIVTKE